MKLYYLSFMAICLASPLVHAQGGLNVNINGVGFSSKLDSYDGIGGSPYLFEQWTKADIHMTKGDVKKEVSARLNAFENELEVISETGTHLFLDKNTLDYVVLLRPATVPDKKSSGRLPSLLFKTGFDSVKGIENHDLVNVLAEGERYTLIRKFNTKLVHPEKSSYASGQGSKFVSEVEFYLIKKDGKTLVVQNRTGAVLKAIDSEDQEAANQLVKERSLDLSTEVHLVEFFNMLNGF